MNKLNVFAAVNNKSVLDPVLKVLIKNDANFLGTEGTVRYLKSKGYKAKSVVSGFDFDGRLKSISKKVFAAILANKSKKAHLSELKKLGVEPIDMVVVDLYKPDNKNFPESMDIGGQALIRAAIKNYKNVALAFDKESINELAGQIKTGSISPAFRKKQAQKASKFISDRGKLEANLF